MYTAKTVVLLRQYLICFCENVRREKVNGILHVNLLVNLRLQNTAHVATTHRKMGVLQLFWRQKL